MTVWLFEEKTYKDKKYETSWPNAKFKQVLHVYVQQ